MGNKIKNILVITGSPRKKGNGELLAKAFIEGAKTNGHHVMLFDAGRSKISPCQACDKCLSNNLTCIFRDDFDKLKPMIASADMIVFVTPLYWYSMSAQLKLAIDKFYSLDFSNRTIESALIVCGWTDNLEDFEGVAKSYYNMTKYLGWKNHATLVVPRVNALGEVVNTDGFTKAKELGLSV